MPVAAGRPGRAPRSLRGAGCEPDAAAPGSGGGVSTPDHVVAYARSFGPGLAVVVVGFAGLLSTLTVRPLRRRRRGYSTGWG